MLLGTDGTSKHWVGCVGQAQELLKQRDRQRNSERPGISRFLLPACTALRSSAHFVWGWRTRELPGHRLSSLLRLFSIYSDTVLMILCVDLLKDARRFLGLTVSVHDGSYGYHCAER